MFKDIKEFLRSAWEKLSSKKFMKRYSWIIVVSVLTLLIPLSIALCYMQFVQSEQNAESPKIEVSVFEPDGKTLYTDETTEKLIDDSYLSKLLFDLSSTKIKVGKPTEFKKNQNIGFSVLHGEEKNTYKCYFEKDASKSFFEDQNGAFYTPNPEAYASFLNSYYAESVYAESTPPTLYTSMKEAVTPLSVDWTYTLINGKETSAKRINSTSEVLSYRNMGTVSFNFSRTPDVCNIEIKKPDGSVVFSGTPSGLSSITANEGDELLVKINAEWSHGILYSSRGTQSYEFKIVCTEPSSFELSATSAVGGQVILICAKNLSENDTVTYSPLPDKSFVMPTFISSLPKEDRALAEIYSYQPIFVREGSSAYALLPIPADIPETTFKFSLSCGISKSTFSIKLKQSIYSTALVEDPLNEIALSSAQKAEFLRILLSLEHSKSDMLLSYGELLSPLGYGFTKSYAYNTQVNDAFTFLGNTYSAPSSVEENVRSIGIGTVAYAGNSPLLGNYVIVDHGMGLLSWYCDLSVVNVDAGDIVKAGDSLGLSGSSSLLANNGVNILCSVGKILIDPSEILGKTLIEH